MSCCCCRKWWVTGTGGDDHEGESGCGGEKVIHPEGGGRPSCPIDSGGDSPRGLLADDAMMRMWGERIGKWEEELRRAEVGDRCCDLDWFCPSNCCCGLAIGRAGNLEFGSSEQAWIWIER